MNEKSKKSKKQTQDLPDGWIVCKSTKKIPDKTYYFNVNTGEKSWEIPNWNLTNADKERQVSSPGSTQPTTSARSDILLQSVSPTAQASTPNSSLNDLLYGGDAPAIVTIDRIQTWLRGIESSADANPRVEKNSENETPQVRGHCRHKNGRSSSSKSSSSAKRRRTSAESCGEGSFPAPLISPKAGQKKRWSAGDVCPSGPKSSRTEEQQARPSSQLPSPCAKLNTTEKTPNRDNVKLTAASDTANKSSRSHSGVSCDRKSEGGDDNGSGNSRKRTQQQRKEDKQQTHVTDDINKPRRLLSGKRRLDSQVKVNVNDNSTQGLQKSPSVLHLRDEQSGVNRRTTSPSPVTSSIARIIKTPSKESKSISTQERNTTSVCKMQSSNRAVASQCDKTPGVIAKNANTAKMSNSASDHVTPSETKVTETSARDRSKVTQELAVTREKGQTRCPPSSSLPIQAKTITGEHLSQNAQTTKSEKANECPSLKVTTLQKVKEGDPLPRNPKQENVIGAKKALPESQGEESSIEGMDFSDSALNVVSDNGDMMEMDMDWTDSGTDFIVTELQELRESIQIDPQEKYGRLTSLDVSPSTANLKSQQGKLIVVLDTNVLINHLKFLEEFKDHCFKECGRPTLIIPWVVMQELDSLKARKTVSYDIQRKAQKAIDFLHKCLESAHPRVKGQSITEASVKFESLNMESNDDRVLHCCLQFQQKVGDVTVVLFSDDKNLCNKAIVSNVPAFTRESLLKGIADLFVQDSSMPARQSTPVSVAPVNKTEMAITKTRTAKQKESQEMADDLLCKLKQILRDALSVVLEAEMKKAYADLWHDIVLIKPPWTLKDVFDCFKKHWFAVFGMYLKKEVKAYIENLSQHFQPGKGFGLGVKESLNVTHDALELLKALREHDSYNKRLDSAVERTQEILQVSKDILNGKSCLQENSKPEASESVTVKVTESEERHVLEVFEVIWRAINYYTSLIFSVLGCLDAMFPAIDTSDKPSRQQAVQLLSTLCTQVQCLSTALINMLNIPSENLQERQDVFEELSQAIYAFIQNVPIADLNCRITARSLYGCCQHLESRNSLLNGHGQLVMVLEKLMQCASNLSN